MNVAVLTTARYDQSHTFHAEFHVKKKAPTASQQRFHNAIAQLGCVVPGCGGPARLHHCVGASAKHNKIAIGQWWLIPLCDDHHQHGPDALHVSPARFALLVGVDSRKRAEKYLFSVVLTLLAVDGQDGMVPDPVMEAIESYTR